jgi:2,4-didehydro-3-deoxy-L-rhamnonate hydrolase
MKLARFGNPGAEKPGLVDDQGRLRDLSNVIADLTPANLSRSALQKIAAIAPSTLPLVAGETRFGAPIAGVGKFIAIGLNYADHAAEANLPLPSEPIVFRRRSLRSADRTTMSFCRKARRSPTGKWNSES